MKFIGRYFALLLIFVFACGGGLTSETSGDECATYAPPGQWPGAPKECISECVEEYGPGGEAFDLGPAYTCQGFAILCSRDGCDARARNLCCRVLYFAR